jgi:ornithine carbamoyltransferase
MEESMSVSLKGRSFVTLLDYSAEEIDHLITRAEELKAERSRGERRRRLEGYTLALIFEKRSTRTRCSFETAFGEEGGYPVFLSGADIHLGVKEDLSDTARVLGRMFDCIQFRGYKQETVDALVEYSGVPVYNGLTDPYHPTQVLADLMTLKQTTGTLGGRTLAYVGDGRNNVARSLMIGCSKVGVNFRVVAPGELEPEKDLVAQCGAFARRSGSSIAVTDDPKAGLAGADAVYTDVWASMGEEDKAAERAALLTPYRVTAELMDSAGPESIFLHCLPAVKGQEVTKEVFESPKSRVFDQAENRKHTIKAIILSTLLG